MAVSDTKILAGSVDGSARTFDVRGGVEVLDDFGTDRPVVSVAFSGDGNCALVGTLRDRLVLLDIDRGDVLATTGRACRVPKTHARPHDDDAHAAAASDDGFVAMGTSDADGKGRLRTRPGRGDRDGLAPDRAVMATAADGLARVWVPPGEHERARAIDRKSGRKTSSVDRYVVGAAFTATQQVGSAESL